MPFISIVIIALALIGGGVYFFSNRASAPATAPVENAPRALPASRPEEAVAVTAPALATATEPFTPPSPGSDVAAAINGTYTANTSYLTPARTTHNLSVALTVANDVVTDAQVTYDDGGFSNQHQERFDSAYKAQVVGKRLNDISLSRVGGASLTSDSFNEAVKQIIAQTSV